MMDEPIFTDISANHLDVMVRPCPFCGGNNGMDEQGNTYRWRRWRCNDCGATGPEVRCHISGRGRAGEQEARRLAVSEWNARADASDLLVAVGQIIDAGHMDQEHLARLRAAYSAA